MDTIESGKRITLKRTRPNPLFQSWLEELYEEAKLKKSKLESLLTEALISISKYPLPLQSGAECAILNGFNKRLCTFLDKRLEVHNSLPKQLQSTSSDGELYQNNNYNLPSTNTETTSSSNTDKPKSRLKNNYKPAYRSGGYAILIALLENFSNNGNGIMDKDTLIEHAQQYCDESFTTRMHESYYTAWSNMQRLLIKGLVKRSKSKKIEYSLTEQGVSLAKDLLKSSQEIPTTDDVIFNCDSFSQNQTSRKGLNNDADHNIISGSTSNFSNTQPIDANNLENSNTNGIEMDPGSFDIILLIDKNEISGVKKKGDPTVAQFKKYPNLIHEYRSLKVGDFTWVARHKVNNDQELVLPYIVERKRMDDLGASIKDGRFHEQKFRLRRCGIENVIYMIENYGCNKNVGLPVQSLMQALANTRVIDGFAVHVTKSLTYSARFLAMLTKRLTIRYKDKKLKGSGAPPEGDALMTFGYFNKSSIKNKPLTVTEAFIKILLQLKGVSVEKAVAITNQYKTPHSLISAYKLCEQKGGEFLLANLKYGDLTRNVGPTASKSVHQLFTKTSW